MGHSFSLFELLLRSLTIWYKPKILAIFLADSLSFSLKFLSATAWQKKFLPTSREIVVVIVAFCSYAATQTTSPSLLKGCFCGFQQKIQANMCEVFTFLRLHTIWNTSLLQVRSNKLPALTPRTSLTMRCSGLSGSIADMCRRCVSSALSACVRCPHVRSRSDGGEREEDEQRGWQEMWAERLAGQKLTSPPPSGGDRAAAPLRGRGTSATQVRHEMTSRERRQKYWLFVLQSGKSKCTDSTPLPELESGKSSKITIS